MNATRLLLAAAVLLGACHDPATTAPAKSAAVRATPASVDRALGADVEADLATLRRVTAPFHRFEAAQQAGWSAPITKCMVSGQGLGGMGFHWGNPAIIDGRVRVDEPELLIYEPEKNGQRRLVGVEYIVPLTAWHEATPPRLFGRDFTVNTTFQVWALHAWVWKENPSGMFASWNPKASCAAVGPDDTMVM